MTEASSPQAVVAVSGSLRVSDKAKLTADRLAKGVSVGRYRLIQLLGEGGMGVVYEAYDPALQRRVALKLIKHGHGSAGKRRHARLMREALALARISHPNIVGVYDVGTDNGHLYVAAELLRGRSLKDWLRDQARSYRKIIAAFCDAGRGLAAAHEQGLVHRDFKPANVIVGDDGRVRVLDFSLSRIDPAASRGGSAIYTTASSIDRALAAGAEAAVGEFAELLTAGAAVELTGHGSIMGTPGYMAPEQYLGARVDAKADQFSFCVSLYRALYGQSPFSPDNDDSADAYERAALAGELRMPPSKSAVPTRVFRVLRRGMSRVPHQRYASMDELLAELERVTLPRRRRLLTMAAAALLAFALGMIAAQAMPAWRIGSATQAGDARPEAAQAQATAAASANPAGPELDPCANPTDASGDPSAQTAELCQALGAAYAARDAGELTRGLTLASDLAARAKSSSPAALHARALFLVGYLKRRLHDTGAAERSLERAVFIAAAAGDTRTVAQCLIELVWTLSAQPERLADAEERYRDATLVVAEIAGAELPIALDKAKGALYAGRGQLSEALALWLEVLPKAHDAFGPTHIEVGEIYSLMGTAAATMKLTSRARRYLEEAVAVLKGAGGAGHGSLVQPMRALAATMAEQGERTSGLAYARRSAEIAEQVFGTAHPEVAISLALVGRLCADEGDVASAQDALTRALTIYEQQHDRDQEALAQVAAQLAEVLMIQGRKSDARALMRRTRMTGARTAGRGLNRAG